jgi:hypothetical protein
VPKVVVETPLAVEKQATTKVEKPAKVEKPKVDKPASPIVV